MRLRTAACLLFASLAVHAAEETPAPQPQPQTSRAVMTVEQVVIGLTEDLVEDWGLDGIEISKDTFLKGDLGFGSSDTMQLFAMIQEYYAGMAFKFQDLVMKDGKFVDDLKISQIVVFILKKLSSASDSKEAATA